LEGDKIMPREVLIGLISIHSILCFTYFGSTGANAGHHYLNPIINYEEWYKLNVFGVFVLTLLLNVLFFPFAMLYWFIKILIFLFTVGRR
jgi:hypothetical protein